MFVSEEEKRFAYETALSIPHGDLFGFRFWSVPLGRYAQTSVTGFFRLFPKVMFAEMELVARQYIETGVLVCIAAKSMIEQLGIDIVVTTGGQNPVWGPIFDIAGFLGKRAVNWEDLNVFPTSMVFSHEQPACQFKLEGIWEKEKTYLLTKRDNDKVDEFLYMQRSKIAKLNHNIEYVRNHLQLIDNKPIVTIYGGLPWDGMIYNLDKAFSDMYSAVVWLIEYAIKRDDITLIVRCHPAESVLPSDLVPFQLKNAIAASFPNLPTNIKIIGPESEVSSYALIELSNINIAYVSTMGLETALMGKKAWVLATPHYSGKGFTEDISSADHLRELLDTNNFDNYLSEEQRNDARTYLHLAYFRHLINMPFLDNHTSQLYKIDSFTKLLPNGDQVINDLCNCILERKDFIDVGKHEETVLISIIVPFLNMEKTIREAIESVLLQSYTNWELILIDDGSTDNTLLIVKEFVAKRPGKIQVFCHPGNLNRGASASRNLGFLHARGTHIAYLDADDIFLPDKLMYEVDVLAKHPEAFMVMSPVRYFSDFEDNQDQRYDQDLSSLEEGIFNSPDLMLKFIGNFGVTPCPSATLIRKEAIIQIGGWENPFRRNCTDQVFWAKLSSQFAIYVSKKIVTCYRQHANSSWEIAHREKSFIDEEEKFWSWLLKYSEQWPHSLRSAVLAICLSRMPESLKETYAQHLAGLENGKSSLEDRVPWINSKAKKWLDSYVNLGMRVFEYGSGGSTLYFLENGCELVSVEHDPDWYQKVHDQFCKQSIASTNLHKLIPPSIDLSDAVTYRSKYPGYDSSRFVEYVSEIDCYPDEYFDIISIDGRARNDCFRHALTKLKSSGIIMLDNSERERYLPCYILAKDWQFMELYGLGPYETELCQTTVFSNRHLSGNAKTNSDRTLPLENSLQSAYGEIVHEPSNELNEIGTVQALNEYSEIMTSSSRVLDVDCGRGFAMKEMKRRNLNPVGITVIDDDCVCCQSQGLNVLKQDMSHMTQIGDGDFDGVFARHSLEHSPIPVIALRELWRVIKPRAWMIVIVQQSSVIVCDNHYNIFEPREWASLFAMAGFELTQYREVREYSIGGKRLAGEYPEYQFVLYKSLCDKSVVMEANLATIKRLCAASPVSNEPFQANKIDFGSVGRLTPISHLFGTDRMHEESLPLCWHYIRKFLETKADAILGRVLEIGDNTYTKLFGGDRVTLSDILHATTDNPAATIIADLTKADNIASNSFDCIICTQTLHVIYDVEAALQHLYRILKPGGVLLASLPGISQISRYDMDRWGDYWRFTTASVQRLFGEVWPDDHLEIQSFGNVLTSVAYLHGLVSGEIPEEALDYNDKDYQMMICVCARKPHKATDNTITDNSDDVKLISSGWDTYAKTWNADSFKVLLGESVAYLGDEWTAEDVTGGGTTYGLDAATVHDFKAYLLQQLLDPYLPQFVHEGLEIGPGGGRVTELLKTKTGLLHVADSSEAMLTKLKERFVLDNNLLYHFTDGINLPSLLPESLDYVLAFDVFVHFEPRLVYYYIRQIANLLKPGGIGIIHYANLTSSLGWQQFESDVEMNVRQRTHFASFGAMCPAIMQVFLVSLGLEIVSVDTGLIPRDAVAVFKKSLLLENCFASKNVIEANPTILLYHRVANIPLDPQLLAVSPRNFDAHLLKLVRNYRVLPLYELLQECKKGPVPPNSIALTFDDGYQDNLTNVLPLLERYGLHATIFVTSGMVGSNEEFWWDALEAIFLTGGKLPRELSFSGIQWKIDFIHDRVKVYHALCGIIRDYEPDVVDQALQYLFDWAGVSRTARDTHRTMGPSQLKMLAGSSCVEIGSHAQHHARLSTMSLHNQMAEMTVSKKRLEFIIGRPVRLFSYPYGTPEDFDEDTRHAVGDAGYVAATANIQGSILPSSYDPFAVPRRLVRNWTADELSRWLRSPESSNLEQQTIEQRDRCLQEMGQV
jgi:glycosyltransferase involved in cell wall biosynthesis/peptidoglycan/xylan/chitin deacetylase (PgdA/CDA1 family)/ubiquinone/menaquinone biosynthesis C-methylase UbiE